MSNLTGFDSEVVGFDCVTQDNRPNRSSSAQTTEYSESGAGSQTNESSSSGTMVQPGDLRAEDNGLKEYPPPGLNEFLRRVVPAMMEQLGQNDEELLDESSDSDEEDVFSAKLLQEIDVSDGSGDRRRAVLGAAWSGGGGALAAAVGPAQHDEFAPTAGLVKVYTLKRSEDRFVHTLDIAEKNCVSVLEYHPAVAALLAYGTVSGEVVVCSLARDAAQGSPPTSPADAHASRRVTALRWADAPLADLVLTARAGSEGKRRGAADQVLWSAGADGSLCAWRVTSSTAAPLLELVTSYAVAADVTCFDLPRGDVVATDVFVVGTKTGKLYLCKIHPPASEALAGHGGGVLHVAFSSQRPGVFVSVSVDAELRVYDVNQRAPLKVLWLEGPARCACWVSPARLVLGLRAAERPLRVLCAASGRELRARALHAAGAPPRCLAVSRAGSRLAAGDERGALRVWALPARRGAGDVLTCSS